MPSLGFFLRFGLTLSLLGFAGLMDWMTGYEVSVLPLYALPVIFAAWFLSGFWGYFFALWAALQWMLLDSWSGHAYSQAWIGYSNGATRWILWSLIVFMVRYMRRMTDLASRSLEAFNGPVPICNQCGRLEAKDGEWMTLETYLREHTRVQPKARVCPSCVQPHTTDRPLEPLSGGEA